MRPSTRGRGSGRTVHCERAARSSRLSLDVWVATAAADIEDRIGITGDADSFIAKLQHQLRDLPDAAILLGAEVLYVELLAETSTKAATKRSHIDAILGLLNRRIEMPPELDAALAGGGVADYGAGMAHRHAYLQFILRLARAWTEQDREALLGDPWGFRDFAKPLSTTTDVLEANAVLHLLFPDTFESVVSSSHRTPLIAAFASAPAVEAAPDDDRKIAEIRRLITRDGDPPVDLYSLPFSRLWREPASAGWNETAAWANRLMQVAPLS